MFCLAIVFLKYDDILIRESKNAVCFLEEKKKISTLVALINKPCLFCNDGDDVLLNYSENLLNKNTFISVKVITPAVTGEVKFLNVNFILCVLLMGVLVSKIYSNLFDIYSSLPILIHCI